MKSTQLKFSLSILLFCLPPVALCQSEKLNIESLENTESEALFSEIPSVYTASKYEQKVTKAPASVSIVTADEIKKWGYRNFGDIIASLKGFYSTNDRNYGYVGARGFGLPSDYNTRLLLLIDGHRYNENVFESFTTDENFPVDIDMIERVEVVRGPSSSLYGTNAVFGVINIITKRGRDQGGGNVKTSYGSFDATKTSVSYGKRFNNGLEAFFGGSFYYSNGNDNFFSKEFVDPATNNGFPTNRGFYNDNDDEEAKKFLGKLTFGDFTFEGLIVERKKNIPTASFGTRFNDPDANTVDQAYFYDLKYDHTFENQLNLQARFSYNHYRYHGNYPLFESGTGNGNYDNLDMIRGRWWRGNIEATQIFWDNHKITFGCEFQHDFDQFQTNFDILSDGSTRKNGFSENSAHRWALYAQDEFTISDNLTFNAGLRYDNFSTFGDTINPRLALIYAPWESTTLKLLYGTAFRAPSAFENHASVIPLIPNDKLQPENFESTEFILEHYFNHHLRGEFNLFHTEISDIITQVNIDQEGTTQNQNVDNVRSNGFELQMEDNWSNGFQWRISYSWQDTKFISTDDRIPNSPEHMVKLNLIAPIWEDVVFMGFETRYMSNRSRQLLDPNTGLFINNTINDNVISNLTIFTRNWVKGLELSAGLYNLFDERYFDPGATEHTQIGIQQDGLTFRTKVSMDF